jgi:chemotaxis regulatin CheY-phosphate phosphatase CheZ
MLMAAAVLIFANSGEDDVQHRRYRIESFLPVRPALPEQAAGAADAARPANGMLEHGAAELAAAMEAMEKACAFMLGTAERVEDHARALSATAVSDETRELASDIREQMIRVYELCNFQDVAGQRIAKVIRLLTGEPDQPANNRAAGGSLANGPRLDGAAGYVTQDDVDALFGYKPASA